MRGPKVSPPRPLVFDAAFAAKPRYQSPSGDEVLAPAGRLAAGLTTGASLDALAALEVLTGKPRFWNPETLSAVEPEVLEAYIDQSAGRTPGDRRRLKRARACKNEPACDRVLVMRPLLERAPEDQRWALAYAAGLPAPLVEGVNDRYPDSVDCKRDTSLTWLPEGLKVPGFMDISGSSVSTFPAGIQVGPRVGGFLFLSGSAVTHLEDGLEVIGRVSFSMTDITELPKRFRVGCELDLRSTRVKVLPEDLQVESGLSIGRSPLESLTDAEIRAMAPGVSGKIDRW